MKFATLFFTLLSTATFTLAGFQHAADAADGLYTHYTDSDGVDQTAYMSPITRARSSRRRLVQRDDNGPQCQPDITMNVNDANAALMALAGIFGPGYNWTKSISVKSGSAVVYGCDYGKGQTMSSDQLIEFMNDITRECGVDSAGYFRVVKSKCAYGRTNTGIGFC